MGIDAFTRGMHKKYLPAARVSATKAEAKKTGLTTPKPVAAPQGPTVARALAIAASQVGTKESGNNRTKYHAPMGLAYGQPWCATFVSWVLHQAGFSKSELRKMVGPNWHHVFTMRNHAKKIGMWASQPQPGYLVVFSYSHIEIVEKVIDANYIQTIGGNGLPNDERVLSDGEWVRIDSLKVGDPVHDPRGDESVVTGVYPQGKRPCYRLTFSDNRTIVADENHRWTVQGPSSMSKWIVKTTKELAESGSRWQLPRMESLPDLGDGGDLPMHPWMVGAFIGDGCLTRGPALAASEEFMQEKAKSILGEPRRVDTKKNDGYADGHTLFWGDDVRAVLVSLGLMGHKWDTKTIPESYMQGSAEDRIALLQGLLDSDGYCDPDGKADYATGNEHLALQVAELVKSLGGTSGFRVKKPTYRRIGEVELRDGSPSYVVTNIRVDFNPFTRPRKAERYTPIGQRKLVRGWSIKSIERIEDQETTCISVSAPSETYVAGDWIVTHNTSSGNRGSQNNGDGVWRRKRSRKTSVQGYIKIPYDTPSRAAPPLQVGNIAGIPALTGGTKIPPNTDPTGIPGPNTPPPPPEPDMDADGILRENGVWNTATAVEFAKRVGISLPIKTSAAYWREFETKAGFPVKFRDGELDHETVQYLQWFTEQSALNGVWNATCIRGVQRWLNKKKQEVT